jgi:hypothetical protein
VGDGWYWCKAENFAATSAATPTGVAVVTPLTPIYVSGFQFEEKAIFNI